MALPTRIRLCEVGPRDGFQFEATPISTSFKVEIIRGLAAAGIGRIQAVSFVHPGRVPQMADAEAVVEATRDLSDVEITGLALNLRGVERASACGLRFADLSIATNERHARDNANRTVEEGIEEARAMIVAAQAAGLGVQLGFQTVFGYGQPGDTPLELVAGLARQFAGDGLESLSLADTTGLAGPVDIRRVVSAVRDAAPDVDLVLHLHDTRGLGLANVVAALELGVTRFDTSLGGLGGCPFIPGATGNIATEDTLWLLERLGIDSGIDRRAVAQVSRRLASHLGRPLTGKLWSLEGGA